MALRKPFKTLEQITQEILENSIMEKCIGCGTEKPIPIPRILKKCDDCLEEGRAEVEAEERFLAAEKRKEAMRIPARYRHFDLAGLEISQQDFKDYCQVGKSLYIQGEIGTGKTNLACQVMIARNSGFFYTANEITTKIAERIQDEKLVIIDDLTEVNSTDERKVEALRLLFHYRYGQQLDTIVTLSKTDDEVIRIFGDAGLALVSRFKQWMFGIVLKTKWR